MESMETLSDLQTAAACGSLIERLFRSFGLSRFQVRPVVIPPETVDFDVYRILLETETAPLTLKTPDECIGGLQFSFMQKRFVYRFDNCVLSYETKCDERQRDRPWVTSGAMYVTPSANHARDLIEKLIQVLPKPTGAAGQIELTAVADAQAI